MLTLALQPGDPYDLPTTGTIEPLYVKALPESAELRSAIPSPDGRSIWAVVHTPMVDVGKLLNQHAMLGASIAAACLTLTLFLWLMRAARRRRIVGALHCARCDYNVTGLAPALCPECGVDLNKRPARPGQTRLRRLGLPAALLAMLLGTYAWFAIAGRHTFPQPFPEGRWGSLTLLKWSSASGMAWIKPAIAHGELLLELDTQTGTTRRIITARSSTTYFPLVYNAAAEGIYLDRGFHGVDLVSVKSGSVIASLDGHAPAQGGFEVPFIMGHTEEGAKVYLNCADERATQSWVTEWDWRTGAARDFLYKEGWNGGTYHGTRHHALLPGVPLRFLRFTDFGEAFQSAHYRITLLDASGVTVKERDLGERVDSMAVPTFSTDGELIFLDGEFGSDILALNSTTLEDEGTLKTGINGGRGLLPISADGRLMLVPHLVSIAVRDVKAKKWGPALSVPRSVYGPHSVTFSSDGRTVSAVFQSDDTTGTSPGGFVFQLGVWKLP